MRRLLVAVVVLTATGYGQDFDRLVEKARAERRQRTREMADRAEVDQLQVQRQTLTAQQQTADAIRIAGYCVGGGLAVLGIGLAVRSRSRRA